MAWKETLQILQGLAAGDAFGRAFSSPEGEVWLQRRELPPGPWKWSDDTQLALSVVEELNDREWIDQDYLVRRMARAYINDPARGYGIGTRHILGRVAHGEYFRPVLRSRHPDGSYGGSAASRAAVVGAFFAGNTARLMREARLAAGVTHVHPEAAAGAQAVAAAVAEAVAVAVDAAHPAGSEFLSKIVASLPESEVRSRIERMTVVPPLDMDQAVDVLNVLSDQTVLSCVPYALWCAAHHLGDFEEALWWTVSGGGRRDTNCAIAGAVVAGTVPELPEEWRRRCEPLPPVPLPSFQDSAPTVHPVPSRAQVSVSIDSLTGLPNLIGLLKWSEHIAQAGEVSIAFSLVAIHLVALWEINRTQGRAAGDDLIQSFARDLQQKTGGPVYRVGGNKFIIVIKYSDPLQAKEYVINLMNRLNPALKRPCQTAIIHFVGAEEVTPGKVLACLDAALKDRHYIQEDGIPRVFQAMDIRSKEDDYPWMTSDMADQILKIGRLADEAVRLSETDSVSQLPNMRAALNALDFAIDQARWSQEPLAVLMIDGDNLRQFNQVGYAAGDEAIRLMGITLRATLRAADFLARWRTGDEFLILLPNTEREGAVQLAERLCKAIETASTGWLFRTSVSIGVAIYPDHGKTMQDLLDSAEMVLEEAKRRGKNRVVVAGANRTCY